MAVITARNSDGTVSVDGGAPVVPLATGGTKAQHRAHVLLQQLKQGNAAKAAHREHVAHVEHVVKKEAAQNAAARRTKDAALYDHPSFFGLYKTDYALAKSLSDLRAAGASPRRVGDVYRAGLQARRNEAEVKAQYLERAAAAGFSANGPGAIPQTQNPGALGITSSLSDILGSFGAGQLPGGYSSGLFSAGDAGDVTGGGSSGGGGVSPMMLAAAGGLVFVAWKLAGGKGKGRKRGRR